MGRRLAAWRALDGRDRRLLLTLACTLPFVEISVRWLGARRTAGWLARLGAPQAARAPSPEELQRAERLARLASIAGRHTFVESRCLAQALLLQAWLRRWGLDPVVEVGVRKDGGHFDAHAWVDLAGHALAQSASQHVPLQAATRRPDAAPAPTGRTQVS